MKTWSEKQGRRLRQKRAGLKLTRDQLRKLLWAKGLKRSVDSIRNWEVGKNYPGDSNLLTLAEVLTTTPEFLRASSAVDVEPFSAMGVSWYRVFPLPSRSSLVVQPILKMISEQGFDYFFIPDSFGLELFWEEFETTVGQRLEDSFQQKAALKRWVRSPGKPKAFVLEGFRGTKEDWDSYLKLISSISGFCPVVLIQSVDPFHCQGEFIKGSWRGLEPRFAEIPVIVEPETFAEDLLAELPYCCNKAIQDVLFPTNVMPNPSCVQRLLEAGVIRAIEGGFDLFYEAWREPWAKKLLSQQ